MGTSPAHSDLYRLPFDCCNTVVQLDSRIALGILPNRRADLQDFTFPLQLYILLFGSSVQKFPALFFRTAAWPFKSGDLYMLPTLLRGVLS